MTIIHVLLSSFKIDRRGLHMSPAAGYGQVMTNVSSFLLKFSDAIGLMDGHRLLIVCPCILCKEAGDKNMKLNTLGQSYIQMHNVLYFIIINVLSSGNQ